ncbi:putative histidine kinase TCS1p [Fimicolochytrium jonesii]|uniref:putative histidine kinase TCS1p n=1 Tax=Fimicolochytrium jonesii TaxID=1396493 RepID=UPI0022FE3226|nr:putative histidine kinase TCS1p [Fimicolochytrium jonesii]KAI8825765.1 putative histidine kinase TCS1p [Fimicolochytrium jonesii]
MEHHIFAQLPSAYVVLDSEYRILAATEGFLTVLSLEGVTSTREELIGTSLFQHGRLKEEENARNLRRILDRALATGLKEGSAHTGRSEDPLNGHIWESTWTTEARPTTWGNQPAIMYHLSESKTRRIHSKSFDERFKSAELLQLLVNSIRDYAIFMLDSSGHVMTWNPGARRLKLYSEDEVVGKHFSLFYTPEDIASGKPDHELYKARTEGTAEDEYWRVRKDGSRFWASVLITAVHNDDGVLIGYAKVTRDLTERKMSEQRLVAVYEESAKLKSDLLANMSHEIRTPMNGSLAAAALLAETPLNDEQRNLLSLMTESGTTLLRVINDILDYSKIEAQRIQILPVVFSPIPTIEEIVRGYELRMPKDTYMYLEVGMGVPKYILGDSVRFRQIVVNLIDNAFKFTEKGAITVYIEYDPIQNQEPSSPVAESKMHSGKISVTVKDTGIGMSEETIGKLFMPFSQADLSSKKRYQGTGLGLSISRQLTILMGGSLTVKSTLGEGSTFFLELPFPASRAPNADKGTSSLMGGSNGVNGKNTDGSLQNGVASILTTKRILVAEDNDINQRIVRKILKHIGYENVVIASNGRKAVDVAVAAAKEGKPFDIVFMDIHMPVLDGYEAAALLKLSEATKKTPIVALTANALLGDRDKCLACGMDDYISKPIDITLMGRLLEKWLSPNRGDMEIEVGAFSSEAQGASPTSPMDQTSPVRTATA